MKTYDISMEISGDCAMWARPDTGSTPTSYPIPTWSAVKGIFEAIVFLKSGNAWIRPTHVEICKRVNENGGLINYQQYTTNYRGPLQSNTIGAFQFNATILTDVCYRIYATIENGSGKPLRYGDNPCHRLQAMFERRLSKGQCYKTPCLGWNEFTANYWGKFREDEYEVDKSINENLVSVLNQVFDKAVSGSYAPEFQRNEQAYIKAGVFYYDK
ncbi:CRISPR-associated protein Cas5 [Psychrobacter sp. I-STPA10]|uniref:CRISPR-associated protein Cas5 n=1 Tax=Psychrobacter sp. I-STPA10 TaxID=2585769 RepID=UPI001E559084|nr:CRISPR-associated protein Cas5 [Psychrobacter sp. I-STPA10]